MFSAQIIHDPESAVAKTLPQAIQKLDALMKRGNANSRWGHNISNSAKDLEEVYHHDFIRYLANPAGYTQNGNCNQQIEDMITKTIPPEGKAFIPEDLEQRYTSVKKGSNYDILVENLTLEDSSDDEKNPL